MQGMFDKRMCLRSNCVYSPAEVISVLSRNNSRVYHQLNIAFPLLPLILYQR